MLSHSEFPRIVVAGLAGDSGKTLVSLGLLLLGRERDLGVRAFKKGPDYIDAAWLRWASGEPARNLDTWMMGFDKPVMSFHNHAATGGLNVIEGNRGLFDGADAVGTHSTAELAKALRAPVLLVLNAAKMTRTAAALVLGCQRLDESVPLAGVVLNRVATTRQERVMREAIESACGIGVLGVLPRVGSNELLPGRHLGLVTPEEHPRIGEVRENLLQLVRERLDLERILAIARAAPVLSPPAVSESLPSGGEGLRIGYLSDSAFTFYYPENLDALEAAGAELIPVSALTAEALPDVLDALYIGGGFPETHGASLAENRGFLRSVRERAGAGLPIYAECGGLMLLSRAIHWKGERHEMAGVFSFEVEVCKRPQGHGYAELLVENENPFYPLGLRIRGHEFHYSRIVTGSEPLSAVCAVRRGTGCCGKRDGAVTGNVFAAYTHVHALATPAWSAGMIAAASRYRTRRR